VEGPCSRGGHALHRQWASRHRRSCSTSPTCIAAPDKSAREPASDKSAPALQDGVVGLHLRPPSVFRASCPGSH
jgi:hypothetical protein